MRDIFKDFAQSQFNSVEYNHLNEGWPVYADYDLGYDEKEGKRRIYVVRLAMEPRKTWFYSPLREPALLIEFAQLFNFEQPITSEEAAPKVRDWVKLHGALGANHSYSSIGRTMRVPQRRDDFQWVDEFVWHSMVANRCVRLLAAAKAPDGPNVEELQDIGLKGDIPRQLAKDAEQMVDTVIDMYLRRETFMCRYRLDDGTSIRGPGFLSLLGAMYLQMSNFRDAPTEDIRFCEWCGAVINFEQGDPLPSDAPKGARGKHKTHRNRRFCKEKGGVKDHCKNQYNYNQRKEAKERA
jgi:hypothetical protein